MSQNDVGYSAAYQKVEELLRGWLTETGGSVLILTTTRFI